MVNYKSEESHQKVLDAQDRGRASLKILYEKRIEEYNKKPNLCFICNTPLNYSRRKYKFCSHTCSAIYSNRNHKSKKYCKNCGNEITRKNANLFCSHRCTGIYNKQLLYETIESNNSVSYKTLRDYLMDKQKERCSKCGWGEQNPVSKTVCLDLHHKDGDFKNNKLNNVELLCPNCHSLTDNYKRVGNRSRKSTRIR